MRQSEDLHRVVAQLASGNDSGEAEADSALVIFWGLSRTTIVYWGSIGIMEKKMETTIVYWGYNRDNGKWNGNYSKP